MKERLLLSLMWRHRILVRQRQKLLQDGYAHNHYFVISSNREILSLEFQMFNYLPTDLLKEIEI